MSIMISVAVAAVFFAVSALSLYAPDRRLSLDAPISTFKEHLDCRIEQLMRRYKIPGATIAVVQGGEIVYTMAYGDADRESGRKMAENAPMRVQSISKSVTAWAVMKLVEEGKISLDEPICQYLEDWTFPASSYAADKVTVRQLLCHTAGLPLGDVFALYAPDEPIPSLRESLTKSAVLFQSPGAGFSYSNVGYNLLELLIEDVTGRDFAQYMKSEILLPLGMNHSNFEWSAETLAAVPMGYTLSGQTVLPYRYPERASGGLISTAEDIARFCIAGMPNFSAQAVLTRSSIEQLYSPQVNQLGMYSLVFDGYGFGCYTESGSAVSHGGQGTGWMSHFQAMPQMGDAVVILTNSQRSWPFIASVLNNWARWRGFPAPGMTRILLGECILWAFAGLLSAAAFLQAIGFFIYLSENGIKFLPLRSIQIKIYRKWQFGISAVLLSSLTWCAGQKYLFLTALFPTASWWLGICTAGFAIILLITSIGKAS
jgi:CubicO group peptidase (beta-lactamase class C family)